MAYEPYWGPEGWKDNEDGGTYIDANSLNHMERGIQQNAAHADRQDNPHAVTKEQVGLGSVPNVSTNDQTPTFSMAGTLANLISGETLSVSLGKIMKLFADAIAHFGNRSNPHEVTADQVGAVPVTRKVNGQELDKDLTLSLGVSVVIPVGAWEKREDAEALGGISFYADVPVQGLEACDSTCTHLSPASMEIARQNGMSSASATTEGAIRYYAVSAPAQDLSAQVTITKQNAGGSQGYGSVNTTGDIGVIANLTRGLQIVHISMFDQTLLDYGLTLSDYGKLRAAMYYRWTDAPDLTAEEIAEIFEGADPDEMSDAEIEAAVLKYANLTHKDWYEDYFSICKSDASHHITAKYLPDRQSIQDWIDENTAAQEEP